MKFLLGKKGLEKGQILPMVVFGLIALIAMSALILDGSIVMSHRRTAQAAADAAALAGAEFLCPPVYNQNNAVIEATNYVTLNNAILAEPITFPEEDTIHVEASVESPSFFAQIFDQTQLTANASAEASCTPLSTGHSTLPVGFPCIIPEEGTDSCLINFYNDDESLTWNIENGGMTLLMDSEPSELDCYDKVTNPTGVICDMDGDGRNDIVSMAGRGWLSLENKCSASALINWMDGTVIPPNISSGYWLSTCGAVTTSVYHALKDLVPLDFRVPVYNKQCEKTLPSDECPLLFENGDNEELVTTGSGQKAYRIVGFGLFKVTCVKDKNNDVCPFREYVETHEGYPAQGNKVKSIEGYFYQGTFPSGGGGGVDHGYYVVHLKE